MKKNQRLSLYSTYVYNIKASYVPTHDMNIAFYMVLERVGMQQL